MSQQERRAKQVVVERHRKALLAGLDCSLAELMSGGHLKAVRDDLRQMSHSGQPEDQAPVSSMECHRMGALHVR